MNKNIIFLFALTYLVVSTVILQSNINQFVASLNPPQPVAQNTYPYNGAISQAPDAIWIWAQNWNNSLTPSPIIINQIFYASCGSTMTVYATADNGFTITINGKQILSGNDWTQRYSTNFVPICGINTFSITAYNDGIGSIYNPAGLIYAIVQDPSSCYSCPIGQSWNLKTCSCECSSHCQCKKPQVCQYVKKQKRSFRDQSSDHHHH